MTDSEATEALVALEDTAPDVLFESVGSLTVPLWPLYRWQVARAAQTTELGTRLAGRTSRIQQAALLARRLAPGPRTSARLRRRGDVLFLVSGTTLAAGATGTRDWLVQGLAEAVPQESVIVQSAPIDAFAGRPRRPSFAATWSFADAIGRASVEVRRTPPSAELTRSVERIVHETLGHYPYPVDAAQEAYIVRATVARVARAASLEQSLERILDRVDPRLVLMQGAAYGQRANDVALMRRRGIHVAEPQHGWIGRYHAAYNFGQAMSDPRLLETMPQSLLVFGDYWTRDIRMPSRSVVIGKPHLDELRLAARERRDEVLVLANSFARDAITSFVAELRAALPGSWMVRVRPHPSEHARAAEHYPRLSTMPGVEFDLEPDVLVSLARTRATFGMASTVLYEALAFETPVFVIASALADLNADPAVFGPRVDHANMGDAVRSAVEGVPWTTNTVPLDTIWADDPRSRFRDFVASI